MSLSLRASFLGLAVFIGALQFTGCSTAEIDDNDPAALMKEVEEDIEASRYILAIEKLQTIKNKHPYSKQATEAQLRIADVYFLQDNYAEAAATYEAFRDLHPKHPKINYANYRVALSHFSDIPGNHARDLTPANRAEVAFEEYLYKYPKDEFTDEAKKKLAETRAILAEKEMYIADFYYKREAWDAARGRYQKIASQYAETRFAARANEQLKNLEGKSSE